ncbi:ATP-binding protein [Haloferula chungangensis]|uniref:histidine kinase n=1 Tax=Haloferula chungangensis TaxID=1048331 RepID=A0ABW2L6B0_9BACT
MSAYDEQLGANNFRHLAEALPMITWTANPLGEIDYISSQFYRFTGVDANRPDALDWLSCVHPQDRKEMLLQWEGAVNKLEGYEHQFRLRAANGDYLWFTGKAVPVISNRGYVLKWYGATSEIDKQKRGELAMAEVAKQKDRFIAMLGHELRNPLAAVSLSYDILNDSQTSDAQRKKAFQLLGHQISHLKRLVDDTLDIVRLEGGGLDLITEAIEVNQLLMGTFESFEDSCQAQDLTLKVELAERELWVDGDEVRLSQCLSNLLSNAIKFTPKGGRISLTARPADDGESVFIAVGDSGVGMLKEEAGSLFKPFEQGNAAEALGKDGLGLGLAVVKQLVDLHGGVVTAQSDGLDKGSEFTIALPVIEAPQIEDPREEISSALETKPRTARVLIIEDNESVARALEIFLELDGHEVRHALEGISGLKAVEAGMPDVIFCDLTLPGELKGWDIAEAICDRYDEKARPYLVALSGHAQQEYVERSLKAGFNRHVAKPPEPEVLRECVEVGLARQ